MPPSLMPDRYTKKHEGVAIFCGSAPSVFADLEKAKEAYPDATILGANYTASMIPEIEHVWTQHGEQAKRIKETACRKIYVHSRHRRIRRKGALWMLPIPEYIWEEIDYVWKDLHWVWGSSGVAGTMWAKHGMGFDQVIMAGVSLSQDVMIYNEKYAGQEAFNGKFALDFKLEGWQETLRQFQAEGKTEGVYSMSGFTRELLGAPDGVR